MSQEKKEERRISTRVPAMYEVNFIHDGDYVISSSKDISADGMFLYTKNPPNVSEKTTLSFALGSLEKVEIDAEVVWVNSSGESKDQGMAVRFINPSPQIQEAILKVINKVAVFAE